MHFLRAGVDKRLDADKTPHPAATGQIDVVGGFKVVTAVVLSQFCAETDRRYAVAGVVLAPLLINVVELLGADGAVCLKAEVALGFHEVVIVCDKVMEQLGIVDKIIDQLRARSNRVTFQIGRASCRERV